MPMCSGLRMRHRPRRSSLSRASTWNTDCSSLSRMASGIRVVWHFAYQKPRSSIEPAPITSWSPLKVLVTHAVTLVVLSAILTVNVTVPEHCKSRLSASVSPTGPGNVITSLSPKSPSIFSDTRERLLVMSKLASHSKAVLFVEACGITWTFGGILNLGA